MASKPKRSSFPTGRSGAAQYQAAVRKFNASNQPAVTPRRRGGGQGGTGGRTTRQTRRNASTVTPGSNPLSRATPTKPGQSAYREEQEARRKKGQSYNPNKTPRKPSVEPGTNRLSRHARDQDRKAAAAAAAAKAKAKAEKERKSRNSRTQPPVKPPVKPTVKAPVKATVKDSKSTKNAPAEVKPATKSSQRLSDTMSGKRGLAAKGPHIKSSRLRDALKSVKKYKPKK